MLSYFTRSSLKKLFSVAFKRENGFIRYNFYAHGKVPSMAKRKTKTPTLSKNRSHALAEPIIHLIHTTHVLFHHF